ncbi:MAG: DUF348 domain-containing protein [Anaerolineae bacterium]|nr:DUF348 domain-containing protein [Anaerolineae bacterium]
MELPPPPKRAARGRTGYRRQAALSVHPLALLAILIIVFGAVIFGGFYLLSAQPITLIMDATRQDVRTHQTTVGGMLAELNVFLEKEDSVQPALDAPIRSGMTVTINRTHPVIVEADGQRRRVLTHAVQPRDILQEAGITVGARDLIRVDQAALKAEPYTLPPHEIQVVRAVAVRIEIDGTSSIVYTTHQTVGEALHDAGVTLHLADSVTPEFGAAINEGSQITIRRSVGIKVLVDGRALDTRTHGRTVNSALAEIGIALVGLDYVTPDGTASVAPDMTIRVVRVTEEDTIERVLLDFQRVDQPDPTLPPGSRQVIQQGIPGIAERRVRIRREDGVIVSQSSPEMVVIQKPRDEITAVGTLATPDP